MSAWLAVPLVLVVLVVGAAGAGALIFDGKGWPAALAGVLVIVLTGAAVGVVVWSAAS